MRLLENFEGGGSRIFVEFLVEGWGEGRDGIFESQRDSRAYPCVRETFETSLDNSTGTLVAPRFDIFPASIGIFLRDSILRVSSLFFALSLLSSPLLVFHFTGDSRVQIERCGRNVSRDKLRDIDDSF